MKKDFFGGLGAELRLHILTRQSATANDDLLLRKWSKNLKSATLSAAFSTFLLALACAVRLRRNRVPVGRQPTFPRPPYCLSARNRSPNRKISPQAKAILAQVARKQHSDWSAFTWFLATLVVLGRIAVCLVRARLMPPAADKVSPAGRGDKVPGHRGSRATDNDQRGSS